MSDRNPIQSAKSQDDRHLLMKGKSPVALGGALLPEMFPGTSLPSTFFFVALFSGKLCPRGDDPCSPATPGLLPISAERDFCLLVPAKASGPMLIGQDWAPCLSLSNSSDSDN